MKLLALLLLSAVSYGVPTVCPQSLDVTFSDFELKSEREIEAEYQRETVVNETLLRATLLAREAASKLKEVKETLTLASVNREGCEYEGKNPKVTAYLPTAKSKSFLVFYDVEPDHYNVSFSVAVNKVTPDGLEFNSKQEPKIYSAGKIVYGFVYGKALKFSVK